MELQTFIAPAIAFVVFLALGVATWSYRDVANRHSDRVTTPNRDADDAHNAGH
jgi:hypothetical protein